MTAVEKARSSVIANEEDVEDVGDGDDGGLFEFAEEEKDALEHDEQGEPDGADENERQQHASGDWSTSWRTRF